MLRFFLAALFVLFAAVNSSAAFRAVVYGDSTSEGWVSAPSGAFKTPHSVPALLQKKIRQEIDPDAIVENKAVGGTQAADIWLGVDGKNATWLEEMQASTADMVIINYSLNDVYFHALPTPGKAAIGPAEFARLLERMVITAKKSGKLVVILGPNPVCKGPRVAGLPYYVERLRQVAHGEGIPFIDHYYAILGQPNWQSELADCVHPSEKMYADKAQREFQVLSPIIRSIGH